MIARVAGVLVDARAAARTRNAAERAVAARWITANYLAARGIRTPRTLAAAHARVIELQVGTWTALVSALAAAPMLVDAATLPHAWRVALRLLGVPVLDRSAASAVAAGATVARVALPGRRMLTA